MALEETFVTEIDNAIDREVTEANEGLESAEPGVILVKPDPTDLGTPGHAEKAEADAKADPVVLAGDGDEEVEVSEREAAEAAEAEAREAEADTPPELSSDLVERAVRVGFSLADAKAFASESALASVCEKLEAKAAVEEPPKDDPLDALADLNTDEYEPEVVKVLSTLTQEIRDQRAKIETMQSGQEQAARDRREANGREVVQWFDSSIKGLGEDFVEVLGEGTHDSLAKGSPQLVKRDAIAAQTRVLMAGYQAIGGAMPSRDEIFKQAANSVLAGETAKVKVNKTQGKLRKRAGQHVARGSDSRGGDASTVSPLEEAAALIDAKFGKD